MQTCQLYRTFLLTLNIKICENEGIEDTTVLTRTFITLDKTGGYAPGCTQHTALGTHSLAAESDQAVHSGTEAAHRILYFLPANFHNPDFLWLLLWRVFPQQMAW